MSTPLSVDLFTLRESLIRGDLRDEFEHSVRRKLALTTVPLEKADRNELEQLMYRTWYETALLLGAADTADRIRHVLRTRYISLRARWQRYWTVQQARHITPEECGRTVQLLYDLISDLKSTYLVSMAKALGNDAAMQLWRRCDQLARELTDEWVENGTDVSLLLKNARQKAQDSLAEADARCTAWPPLTLEVYDQLARVSATLQNLTDLTEHNHAAGAMATALFLIDNRALLRGLSDAHQWMGDGENDPGVMLLRSYASLLDEIAPCDLTGCHLDD